jgi:hypothetical protein
MTLVAFIALGCHQNEQTPEAAPEAFYAGQWQATNGQWTLCFAPNGTLDSAVTPLGRIPIRPQKTTHVTRANQTSSIKAGPCDVKYSPETRNLYARIALDDVRIVHENNVIDGNQVDQFMGIVSEDGTTWIADWLNTFNYGPRFPQNIKNDHVKRLIFKKTMDWPIE